MNLSSPHITKDDIKEVEKVLKSGWISTVSRTVGLFEKKISNFTKSKYCLAVNSGTSAIHLALKVIGVDKNDEVIVPSITFVATVNPVLYLKATPIIMDTDKNHNINLEDVKKFIKTRTYFKNNHSYNKKSHKIIKAIIIVHMWGRACNFIELVKICKKRNIKIIEDAAEALGSYVNINKKLIHCGVVGDIGCLSFNANKIITTGSGGAIITNNKKYFNDALYLSNQAKDDSYAYIHNNCGFNYKMNGLSAALGLSQIKKIKKKINKKKLIFQNYRLIFSRHKNFELIGNKLENTNCWMNILYIKDFNNNLIQKLSLFLKKNKIETRRIWRPLNLQKYLKTFETYKIRNSIKFYNKSICLPSDESLNKKKIEKIYKLIKAFYKKIHKLKPQ